MRIRWTVLVALAIASLADASRAAIYMKVDGIPGEVTQVDHVDWIQVADYIIQFTATPGSSGGGGGGSGKSELTKFNVSADTSVASPTILLDLLTGKHIKELDLAVTKQIAGDEKEYVLWKFQDILFTGFTQTGVGTPTTVARDLYSILPAKFDYTYTQFKADGSVDGMVKIAYDLKQQKAGAVETTGNVSGFVFATGTLVPEPTSGLVAAMSLIALVRRRR